MCFGLPRFLCHTGGHNSTVYVKQRCSSRGGEFEIRLFLIACARKALYFFLFIQNNYSYISIIMLIYAMYCKQLMSIMNA